MDCIISSIHHTKGLIDNFLPILSPFRQSLQTRGRGFFDFLKHILFRNTSNQPLQTKKCRFLQLFFLQGLLLQKSLQNFGHLFIFNPPQSFCNLKLRIGIPVAERPEEGRAKQRIVPYLFGKAALVVLPQLQLLLKRKLIVVADQRQRFAFPCACCS